MKPLHLLLDTHVFLWWRADDRKLGKAAREAIGSAELVFVSAASAWEAAVKAGLGKLQLPGTFQAEIEDSAFDKLAITVAHADAVSTLPYHHRDPFDRMLVAQAWIEGLTLVTHDKLLSAYDVPILWA
jgi:PIN domain nuclease of toxin-antitoxin system